MSEKPSWSAGEAADDEPAGIVRLARAALAAPAPPSEAEHGSRERVLAQFRESALPPRHLHAAPPTPADPFGAALLGRVLRRLLGR
ncbi:MAG: hypothetical protein JO250_22020 [Armatimonadetes bacterium]|nr:hypothetical protein [Armatimonadota bacterium]